MKTRIRHETRERPCTGWLDTVTFKEEPRLVLPDEGVFVHGGDGEPSHFRWGWIWFPSENTANHGVHIDYFGKYWTVKVWGPFFHGCKLTLPHKPSDEEVRMALRLVWGDLYGG